MTLTRDSVTAASRVMLPAYALFFAWFGLSYAFGVKVVLVSAPALAYADGLVPLRVWGGVFLTCSVVMVGALLMHRRTAFRFALRMCGLSMALWAGIIGLAVIFGDAAPSAPAWAAFIATACYASDRSLATKET